jgi:hypothetical protein
MSFTLNLKFNADVYGGAPIVEVSSKSTGMVRQFTITAERNKGAVQQEQVTFETRPGDLQIKMLNDYANAGGDRNAYITSASMNGYELLPQTVSLMTNEAKAMAVPSWVPDSSTTSGSDISAITSSAFAAPGGGLGFLSSLSTPVKVGAGLGVLGVLFMMFSGGGRRR